MEQTLNFSDSVVFIFWSMLIFIIVWSIVWKAIALWQAARNNHKLWFIALIVINTLGILEIIYILFISKSLNRPAGSFITDNKPQVPPQTQSFKSEAPKTENKTNQTVPEAISSESRTSTVPTTNPNPMPTVAEDHTPMTTDHSGDNNK